MTESSSISVLAVDDCPVDRRIVEKLLRVGMFEVTVVESGPKAMEVLGIDKDKERSSMDKENKVDIILTDYCMPGMNGCDLLKAVKENSRSKSIPVVLMSSDNDPQRIQRCFALGAEDFIQKPLKVTDIKRLRNYVKKINQPSNLGMKRKAPHDATSESQESGRRIQFAGLKVAS